MKKIKKLLAMIMAMTMVLGMSLTSFAADAAKITVSGFTPNDNTQVSVYEVVRFDQNTNNWVVSSWAEDFVTQDPTTGAVTEIGWNDIQNLLNNTEATDKPDPLVVDIKWSDDEHTACDITGEALGLGSYYIHAIGKNTVYSPMGVNTYTYDESTGYVIGPNEVAIYAKGSSYELTKDFSDEYDQTVAGIGDTVSYDIETVFPSFDKNAQNRSFTITDRPTGLGITRIAVYVGDMENPLVLGKDYTLDKAVSEGTPVSDQVTVSFTPDYIGSENAHAGADVKVVVTAVVQDTTYKNEVDSSNNTDAENPSVERNTGKMTITKVDEAGHALAGAVFAVAWYKEQPAEIPSYKEAEEANAILGFSGSAGNYQYSQSGTVKELAVDAAGNLVLTGLRGGYYVIYETKAPNGYTITEPVVKHIVLDNTDDDKTNNQLELDFDIRNTKLASLPSTGGIGTTIFTIGGCAIMIAAAALYFVNRRKSEEN